MVVRFRFWEEGPTGSWPCEELNIRGYCVAGAGARLLPGHPGTAMRRRGRSRCDVGQQQHRLLGTNASQIDHHSKNDRLTVSKLLAPTLAYKRYPIV
eukprot:6055368-Pleurochrysis_carterae.AAC.3